MSKPNPDMQDAMISRLARIEGQLRGIQRLIREQEDCEKIAQQMTAARKALDKAFSEMLSCMIEQDVLTCVSPQNPEAEQKMAEIKRLLSKYA